MGIYNEKGKLMIKEKYCVKLGDEVLARDMSLEIATLLVTALFKEWYNEERLELSICKQDGDE